MLSLAGWHHPLHEALAGFRVLLVLQQWFHTQVWRHGRSQNIRPPTQIALMRSAPTQCSRMVESRWFMERALFVGSWTWEDGIENRYNWRSSILDRLILKDYRTYLPCVKNTWMRARFSCRWPLLVLKESSVLPASRNDISASLRRLFVIFIFIRRLSELQDLHWDSESPSGSVEKVYLCKHYGDN